MNQSNDPARATANQPLGWIVGLLIAVIVAVGLRAGTNILRKPFVFDESYITVPITDLLRQGWSMRTAIDFDETKGPGLIWLYAIAGEVGGESLNQLRLTSVWLFVLGVVPLLAIARRCGMGGWGLACVALLYALLPYHAVLAQLVMSESSFVALSLLACWLFVAGVRADDREGAMTMTPSRWLMPALFAVVLSILLHNRVHAVALAGAVTLTAIGRLGWRGAQPWIIACMLAGVSRIPLWVHWGGLVSPRFQGLHGLGFRVDGLTYLLAAFAVPLAVFIPVALQRAGNHRRVTVAVGGLIGLGLSLFAMPSLNECVQSAGVTQSQFSGIAATAARMFGAHAGQSIAIGIMAVIGGAGLGALACLAFARSVATASGIVNRLQFWMLFTGWGMYVTTTAPVYDRYALAWAVLLPITWKLELPRRDLMSQVLLLTAIAAWLTGRWLV